MRECQQCKNCFTDDVQTCPTDGMPTMHTISGEPILEGKYQLESRIGQGGMGVVYKARHAYLKTLHAIKIILPDLVGNDPQLVTRFRQEALAAAAIRHQNVVQVAGYGVAQGTMPFLVMEFVEGEDLHDFLAREKRIEPEKAFEMISAICNGIGMAHKQGIIHRDMKPLNIMIGKFSAISADSSKYNTAAGISDRKSEYFDGNCSEKFGFLAAGFGNYWNFRLITTCFNWWRWYVYVGFNWRD
ncbi:MAG: serine/threonine-protein kinase [Aridibacter sp.]